MKKTFTFLAIALACSVTASAQYCMLPGRTSYSVNQPGIKNFKLNTINRSSASVEKPLSQPSLVEATETTTLQRGQTYSLSITHTRDSVTTIFQTARNNIRVWIDYNNDKDFDDAGELVISEDTIAHSTYTHTFTKSFTVPATAPIGTVRLRATAKMSKDAGHTVPTPCDMPKDPIDYHGEMEDYMITITNPTTVGNIDNPVAVAVYPNPTMGTVMVSLNVTNNKNLNISLYDLTGKMVAELLNEATQSATDYHFNLNNYDLNNGVYFIKATSDAGHSFQKLVLNN